MATVTLGSKAEGSIIKLNENGKPVEFYLARQNYESGLNGSGRVLVVRKDCYDKRAWHSSDVNAYDSSDIDAWLNSTYKNRLDADIRAAMGVTKIYYTPGSSSTKTTLERSVFLLSATEMGMPTLNVIVEGEALSSTMVGLLKIAKLNGSAVTQWTRSRYPSYATNARTYSSIGTHSSSKCTIANGSRPALTLPSTLYVSDDGSVSVNTAPTTPGSVTIPSSIMGGTSIQVSWSASADAEGNLEGYAVERSINGGSSWSQIYQGSGRSTANTVPFGVESVMYRVRAYDAGGLYSSYRNSAQVTVINNTAPSAPASITVPEPVLGGGALAVAWGAASDPDGNLAGYELERQVDGGEWTQVYKGADTSYTDSITRGWSSVNYRVRACDAYNAVSAYTTGTARTVDNNRAPVITCDLASGTNLGVKTEGFTVAYSAADADGDAVTVTEAVDGRPVRTFALDGVETAFTLTGMDFMRLLNGAHTLTITASDGKAEAVHTLTFAKLVTSASVTLARPMEADDRISICVQSVTGLIPADAVFSVKVTNNANDDEPVWEDCTTEVRNGGNHIFANQTAAKGFAYNFLVEVERGASGQGGYINSVQGGFQGA